jgi:chemotaxis protein methyltransferase CheR
MISAASHLPSPSRPFSDGEAQGMAAATERFRALVAEHLGLQYEDDKLDWLTDLLAQRMRARRVTDVHRYLAELAQEPELGGEWAALIPDLTVAETYFFRHIEQFHALGERILPERIKKYGALRPLRILSAGSASGEEAYSIAMTVASMPELLDREVRIDAIDINPLVLAKARSGRYRGWSLRDTPDAMRLRWFQKAGQEYVLDEHIRGMVRFFQCNLADANEPLWQQPGVYDVVLSRNVLMYFGTPRMQEVLTRFAHVMAPDAYLLLGHAESLRGLSTAFRLRHTHGTFYYQLSGNASSSSSASDGDHERPAAEPDAAHWAQTIGQSAERVRALSSAPRAPSTAKGEAGQPLQGPSDDLLALFEKERFLEALDLLEQDMAAEANGPDQAEGMPWPHVLRALLLMHVGRVEEAEALCRRQLTSHPFHADLHHTLALCLEAEGRLADAMESDRTASFVDPTFAMPCVHLGLMARRLGDATTCRRTCAMALRLLARESSERIRLFAGGFSREAVRALCQGELNAAGDGR